MPSRNEYTGNRCPVCHEPEYYQVVTMNTMGERGVEVSRRGPSCWQGACTQHQQFMRDASA